MHLDIEINMRLGKDLHMRRLEPPTIETENHFYIGANIISQ